MAATQYRKFPIVDVARRCGLVLDSRTLLRSEVEASCPFCSDHGRGKFHLSLNTERDQYRCVLCGASGNSVSLYARIHGVSNKKAVQELSGDGKTYLFPSQPVPQKTERQPRSIAERNAVYSEMLSFLTLEERHRDNLLERGLSQARIERNGYRSMPETDSARRLLAKLLRMNCDLLGIPGFYTYYGTWTIAGPVGFLIPVRDQNGMIQGMKIRLDATDQPEHKYRWLSSRNKTLINGTRSYSYIHVTGNRKSKRAFVTEGPLKGDVASFLSGDELFVCTGGVSAIKGLKETIQRLGVSEVIEAMDMDEMVNPQVHDAVLAMRSSIRELPNINYKKYTWDAAYKGVDDFLLSRSSAA